MRRFCGRKEFLGFDDLKEGRCGRKGERVRLKFGYRRVILRSWDLIFCILKVIEGF